MEKEKQLINWKGLVVGIIVFILFYYSSFLQLIPISIFNLNISNITSLEQMLLSIFSNIVLLLILFLIFRKDLIREWKLFRKNPMRCLDTGLKYWLLGLGIMMVANAIITFGISLDQAANEQAVQGLISNQPWLMLINAGFIAPIVEELVFRKGFKNAFPNKWLFITASALVFGSLHVITSMTSPLELLYIIPYGALGGAFAIAYQKTDTIYTSTIMHMLHNTILILMSISVL